MPLRKGFSIYRSPRRWPDHWQRPIWSEQHPIWMPRLTIPLRCRKMTKRMRKIIAVFCWLALASYTNQAQAASEELIEMEAGEVKVLSSPDVARVAVGDGH